MLRPDLSNVDPKIIEYIEYLEKKANVRVRAVISNEETPDLPADQTVESLPPEGETSACIITVSQNNIAKRTYRHLYTRQHRGGMGVFGIDIELPDIPVILSGAEENQTLLIFTSRARVFRQPLQIIPSTPLFARGSLIADRFGLEQDETLVAVLPEQAKGYVALASENGRVRVLRHHLFGEHMRQGTSLYNYADYGPLSTACWSPGDADLFLVTRQGMGIRFSEKALSPQGDQGIRVTSDDKVVAITAVYPDSGVFIAGADGRGTIRLMSGFAPNKSPGGSGKIAIKSNRVIGATTVNVNDDLFLISRLGKVIRFPIVEVSSTEGVVQGVNCMGLRGDEVSTLVKFGPIY